MSVQARRTALAALVFFAGALASPTMAQERKEAAMQARIEIPASIKAEHEEIHEELVRAAGLGGQVGEAARTLAMVQHAHFMREEQIAMPPLGLLSPLAQGEHDPAMADVLPLTDSLRAELPRMLEEHKAIMAASRKLRAVARTAGNVEVERLAERILVHALTEEEVLYPAALLVGELVRSQPEAHAAR